MKNNILTLETTKYEIKLDNFSGPLDLLCYLIDKEKMDIYQVKISDITDQYINYLNQMKDLNLDIASEFLVMASSLLLMKSNGLLPKEVEDEAELTEEELIKRIIEYKKYKEISKLFKERIMLFSKRKGKPQEQIELPKKKLDENKYNYMQIVEIYSNIVKKNETKKNQNAINIEKIAIRDTYTVASKVKEIFRELIKKPKFVFNKVFSIKEKPKAEVVAAFSGVLELTRRSKISATQEETFGDITISKKDKTV